MDCRNVSFLNLIHAVQREGEFKSQIINLLKDGRVSELNLFDNKVFKEVDRKIVREEGFIVEENEVGNFAKKIHNSVVIDNNEYHMNLNFQDALVVVLFPPMSNAASIVIRKKEGFVC